MRKAGFWLGSSAYVSVCSAIVSLLVMACPNFASMQGRAIGCISGRMDAPL